MTCKTCNGHEVVLIDCYRQDCCGSCVEPCEDCGEVEDEDESEEAA